MCYVIVTSRSLLWLLISIVAMLLMLSALTSPSWILAPPKTITIGNQSISYKSSLGVYTRCKPMKEQFDCSTLAVEGFRTDSSVFPNVWKAATVFLAFGLTIMCITVFSGIVSCCFQSVFKKSIFTLSGATQAVSGIFYILGVMLYPMAWGTSRVQSLCGKDASAFYPNDCTLGWGLWMSAIGTLLTFLSACLSVPAEKSTSSDKVQDEIQEGHTLICLA